MIILCEDVLVRLCLCVHSTVYLCLWACVCVCERESARGVSGLLMIEGLFQPGLNAMNSNGSRSSSPIGVFLLGLICGSVVAVHMHV